MNLTSLSTGKAVKPVKGQFQLVPIWLLDGGALWSDLRGGLFKERNSKKTTVQLPAVALLQDQPVKRGNRGEARTASHDAVY